MTLPSAEGIKVKAAFVFFWLLCKEEKDEGLWCIQFLCQGLRLARNEAETWIPWLCPQPGQGFGQDAPAALDSAVSAP